jgi:hypothetical protein
MTLEIREDIIERALLCLLAPQAARNPEVKPVKKKKFRRTKKLLCQPEVETPEKERSPARISIVERPSPVTLSVCWSDSTSGHFGEQVWRKGLAHVHSFCVLSGMRIKVGDSVFRPWGNETHVPANGHRMILASSVQI